MARIEQSAGGAMVSVYTDGSPLWPDVSITQANGQVITARVAVNDLHDLRYCIDRVLAQLGPHLQRP